MSNVAIDTQAPNESVMDQYVRLYANDPVAFVREGFITDEPVVPDDWQVEVLTDYKNRERAISIRSGHGVGKTATLAWIITHHILFNFPQKTVATAASEDQLFDGLAAEVASWIGKLPLPIQELLNVKAQNIELKPSDAAPQAHKESFISFRVSRADKPEALAGIHAESGSVLIVGDEASGIPDAIFESASGSMSGANTITILAGNMVRSSGYFYDTHFKTHRTELNPTGWKTHHVSSLTSPRVSKAFIEEARTRYGERSNYFRIRVMGEPPLTEANKIISAELANMALTRDVVAPVSAPILWGLDPGRFDDPTGLAKRQDNVLVEKTKEWFGLDTMQIVGHLVDEYESTPVRHRPVEILIDTIGIGYGVVDRARELKLPVRGINVSETPAVGERYRNLRTELWWKVREWLESRNVNLANDHDLVEELLRQPYDVLDSTGRVEAISKKMLRSKGIRSPNRADALILTFASTYATAAGGETRRDWKQPLRREIKGIV
jgi:phage terminase large subunit